MQFKNYFKYFTMLKLLKESNDILRSCNAVIKRRGRQTNWDSIEYKVEQILKKQHKFLFKG